MGIWVKICGVTRAEDARAAFEAGADAIGINFWPRSKRYCEPEQARQVVRALPPASLVFGVFCDAGRAHIESIIRQTGIGGVQLHGSEAPEDAEGWDLPVIRAVPANDARELSAALAAWAARNEQAHHAARRVSPQTEAARSAAVPAFALRVLVDNPAGGGSGRLIDPALADSCDLHDAILAGGLTPRNVGASVARFRPFGVDTAGGVESAPGIKDARLVAEFIREARAVPGHD